MASLTPEDRAFIDAKPLPITVHACVSDNTQDEDGPNATDAILNLLTLLMIHPVARRLRSANQPVNGALASICDRLDFDDYFDLSLFTPLTTLIANKSADADIWQAVLDLILTLSSIFTFVNGTLRTHSSEFRDLLQKRKKLEESMQHELAGSTYVNVKGFYEHYFENRSWSEACNAIYSRFVKDAALHSFLSKGEAPPEEKEVWEWLDEFQQKYLTQAPGAYYRAKSKAAIVDALEQRQLVIFLKHRSVPTEEPHSARDIRLIGELTMSPKTDAWMQKYFQIATYMRDAFAAQPMRWFVHGFLMFGWHMELWVFDRSGAYASETFDIREHPKRFIRVITGYAMMSDAELGLNPIDEHDKLSVTVRDAITGEDLELQLERTPIVSQATIVSSGTTCYRTLDGKVVVKMYWRPNKPHSEADLLTMAQGVKGIPLLVGSRDVTMIDELRSGLDIKTKKKLGDEGLQRTTDSPVLSTHVMGQLGTSGNKRGPDSTDERVLGKRRSSQMSQLQKEVKTDRSTSPERSSYPNRVLTYLAISPAGRPLQRFDSVLEVLKAFRDAIQAHRSLFLERNILHRDISMNNIILTDPTYNGCSGMLIDLDLAVLVGKDGRSKEKNMVGTLEYMAIQILEDRIAEETVDIEHTYRHDLESFFYVLLSLCIRYGWPSNARPNPDPLESWYTGTLKDIYRSKIGTVTTRVFEIMTLEDFSPMFDCLKPLARKLRDILFTTGALYVETPEKPASLYDAMIAAFDAAIRDVKW